MMVTIFASMALALVAAQSTSLRLPRRLAVAALLVCLVLAMAEFLYEIDSPVDGFRLPWLQAAVPAGQPA